MNLKFKAFLLVFKHPFGVSSNTRNETPTVFIKLTEGEHCGYGEACLPVYLGETREETIIFFRKAHTVLAKISAPLNLTEILNTIDDLSQVNNAAKAAIDMALHDLVGKMRAQTIAQMYGFAGAEPMSTSYTIGIDTEVKLIQKINDARDFSVLKIKAGTENDQALISFIRKHTDKPLYVDVNQGWKDKVFALDMILWMTTQNVVLIEQPLPVAMRDEMAWVTSQSLIPTIADESVKRFKDLQDLKGVFSGVNIKLMKCTGLAEAIKMIDFCKENKLLVFLGCMAESSCGTSAMAQLIGFADYIDLDAPLLYKNDPFSGVAYEKGKVILNKQPGIGAAPKANFLNTW